MKISKGGVSDKFIVSMIITFPLLFFILSPLFLPERVVKEHTSFLWQGFRVCLLWFFISLFPLTIVTYLPFQKRGQRVGMAFAILCSLFISYFLMV